MHDQKNIKIERDVSQAPTTEEEICVYFKTKDTEKAVLIAQRSDNHPDEIAIMASFAPSFLEAQPH